MACQLPVCGREPRAPAVGIRLPDSSVASVPSSPAPSSAFIIPAGCGVLTYLHYSYSTCSCICSFNYSCRCSRCRCSQCTLYVPPESDPRQYRIRGSLSPAQTQYFSRSTWKVPASGLTDRIRSTLRSCLFFRTANSPDVTSLISRAPTILTFPSALTGLGDFGPSCLS